MANTAQSEMANSIPELAPAASDSLLLPGALLRLRSTASSYNIYRMMTEDQVRQAFNACDMAFKIYVKEATETHRLLSALAGSIAMLDRQRLIEQRIKENAAQALYLEARNTLFHVLLSRPPQL